jgi:hypothetical protein
VRGARFGLRAIGERWLMDHSPIYCSTGGWDGKTGRKGSS